MFSEKRRRDFLVRLNSACHAEEVKVLLISIQQTREIQYYQQKYIITNIFPNEDTTVLQHIYQACDGDVNVAVQVVTKSMSSHVFVPPPLPLFTTPSSMLTGNQWVPYNLFNAYCNNLCFYSSLYTATNKSTSCYL